MALPDVQQLLAPPKESDVLTNYIAAAMQRAELKRLHMKAGEVTREDETTMMSVVETPQDLLVIAAGGKAGVQSCFIPGWGAKAGSQSVTKEIRVP